MPLTESLCHTLRISIRSNSCVLMIENVAVERTSFIQKQDIFEISCTAL